MFFYDVGQRVGIDKMAETGHKLGMGVRHDLPMSAISEGKMPNKAWKQERYEQEWVIGDTINASIGQGYVLATPLQLAVMASRIAAGKQVAPRIIHSVNDIEVPIAEVEGLGLDGSKLRAVQMGMFEVMNGPHGTGRGSRIADDTMQMCGKSGTAQVRNFSDAEKRSGATKNEALPWRLRDHALFVGFAPANAPRYAVSVVVEHGGGGSAVAGPIARDALLRALTGGIPPLTAYPADQRGRMESRLNDCDCACLTAASPRPRRYEARMSFLEYRLKLAPTGIAKVFYINWALILVLTAIAAIGWLMLYSIAGGDMDTWALPQIKRFGMGLAILFFVAFVPIWFWRSMSGVSYLIAMILLLVVEFFGTVGMGAQRWIDSDSCVSSRQS